MVFWYLKSPSGRACGIACFLQETRYPLYSGVGSQLLNPGLLRDVDDGFELMMGCFRIFSLWGTSLSGDMNGVRFLFFACLFLLGLGHIVCTLITPSTSLGGG